jgi:hypothetical protein
MRQKPSKQKQEEDKKEEEMRSREKKELITYHQTTRKRFSKSCISRKTKKSSRDQKTDSVQFCRRSNRGYTF